MARYDGIFVKDGLCLSSARKSTLEELSAKKRDDGPEPTCVLDIETLPDLRRLRAK